MKKFLIIISLLTVSTCVYAANTKDILSSIENGVFGYDYNNEPETQRVERLEEYMYGQKKSGTIQARINSLQNDSGIIVVEAKKKNEHDEKMNNSVANQPVERKPDLKEDDTVEYTIVDKMEESLFNRNYKNENIYDRLNRLETKVFQKTNSGDLSSRVDKLTEVLTPSRNRMPMSDMIAQEEMQRYYGGGGFQSIDEQSMPFQLASLEHDVLKREYTADSNSGRLSRLEQKLFNRTFPNEADKQRLQRVLAAYEAKKDSYKYENNRKMQNIATMSQIGGILLMILAILL